MEILIGILIVWGLVKWSQFLKSDERVVQRQKAVKDVFEYSHKYGVPESELYKLMARYAEGDEGRARPYRPEPESKPKKEQPQLPPQPSVIVIPQQVQPALPPVQTPQHQQVQYPQQQRQEPQQTGPYNTQPYYWRPQS